MNSLQSFIQLFKDGKLNKDDQVLVYINSHGGRKLPGTDAHRVFFAEGDSLLLGSIDQALKTLVDAGIKVALVDASCYSGNSIELARSVACVVTAQNRYNESRDSKKWHSFPYAFIKAVESGKGKTLEDIFLSARRNLTHVFLTSNRKTNGAMALLKSLNYSNDFPEISSAEQEQLRPLWDRLFFTNLDRNWYTNYSYLACPKIEGSSQDLRRAFDLSVKAAFGDDSATYESFLDLQLKRASWIEELARVDAHFIHGSDDNEADDVKISRRNTLTNLLEKTEDDYQRLLGKVMLVERHLYTELYHELQKSNLRGNPCRNFNF